MERPRRRSDLMVRSVDGEVVVLDARNGLMHVLKNPSAAFIFDEIDGERTAEEICRRLAEAFELPLEEAERDGVAFLRELEEQGLLEAPIEESTDP